ncbi:MAG: transglutaminase family protein, partial [Acidimicrobiales bacterium]
MTSGPSRPAGRTGRPADLGRAARSSAPATAALAAFDLLAAAGMGRLFRGSGWIVPVLGSAATAHALSWAARRARLALWVAAPLIGLAVLLVLIWSVLGASTWYGIPSPHSFGRLGHDLAGARAAFAVLTAPVPTLPGFLVVAGFGAALIAVLADWAAFRLQTLLEAVVPGLALLVFLSVLAATPPGSAWSGLFVALLATYVAIHEASRRATGSPWFTGGDGRRPVMTQAGTAMVVAVAIGGAIIGPRLPGAASAGLVSFRHHAGAAAERTTISPLVDIRSRLVGQSNTELFTVRSATAAYWRLTSLDHFDGNIWSSNESYSPASGALPGGLPSAGGTAVSQTYHIENLGSIWLPAAYIPTRIDGAAGASWDPLSQSLISRSATSNGETYSVVSETPSFSPAELRSARPDPPVDSRYTVLPPGVPADVIALARRVTAGAATRFDEALDLQNYLRDNYHYSLDVQPGHSDSAIQEFLFQTKTGYCEQFAGAYAVMARAVGLPTRVAVGFTPGQLVGGVWHVFGADAHAWPEVLLGQYGWVPFEPTPGRGNPSATSYTGVAAAQARPSGVGAEGAVPETVPSPAAAPPPPISRHLNLRELGGTPPSRKQAGRPGAPLITLLVVLALVLLWVVGVPTGRRYRRLSRRRRAADDPERILVAWREANGWLELAGYPRRPDETLLEHAGRAGPGAG